MIAVLGKVVIFLIVVLVLIPAVLLLSAFITGRIPRAYEVLAQAAKIQVGGQQMTVADLAKCYAPIMKIRSSNPTPDLLWAFYEVVDNQDQGAYDIVYYNVWENEIHPNPTLHKLYSAFRAPYYGYPLYDIEYVQVSVDKIDGEVRSILHEDSPGDDYFVTISEHLVARYVRQGEGSWTKIVTDRQGKEKSRSQNIAVTLDGTHPVLAAATWNHLSRLISPQDPSYDRVFDPALRSLSDQEYSRLKFARKSQGDHKTSEPWISAFLGGLAGFALILIPGWLITKVLSLKRKAS